MVIGDDTFGDYDDLDVDDDNFIKKVTNMMIEVNMKIIVVIINVIMMIVKLMTMLTTIIKISELVVSRKPLSQPCYISDDGTLHPRGVLSPIFTPRTTWNLTCISTRIICLIYIHLIYVPQFHINVPHISGGDASMLSSPLSPTCTSISFQCTSNPPHMQVEMRVCSPPLVTLSSPLSLTCTFF